MKDKEKNVTVDVTEFKSNEKKKKKIKALI